MKNEFSKELLLAPSTVRTLSQSLDRGDLLFYYSAPDYIINFFKENGFELEKRKTPLYEKRLLGKEYPSEEEFLAIEVLKRKYKINEKNWRFAVNISLSDSVFYADETVNGTTKEFLRKIGLDVREEKPPTDALKLGTMHPKLGLAGMENMLNEGAQIAQFTGAVPTEGFNYRRYKLNKYLSSRYSIDTLYSGNGVPLDKKYKAVFFSDPKNSYFVYLKTVHDKSLIIYDRTDNWQSCGKQSARLDNLLMKSANLVFCSAKWLYDGLPDKSNAWLVPNGCDVLPYEPCEKFPKKTAVYIGYGKKKIDWKLIDNLANRNKDWDVLVYGNGLAEAADKPNAKNILFKGFLPETELFEVLKKCHVGLIPFLPIDWTKGMLPLKLFQYANARLPSLYWNCAECEAYKEIAFPGTECSLNDIYNMDIPDECFQNVMDKSNWTEKFDFMISKAKEKTDAFD